MECAHASLGEITELMSADACACVGSGEQERAWERL
jgi:hypothetical protein